MSWSTPKTWIQGGWPVGDANTYIRDNESSLRRFQYGTRAFAWSSTGVGTTPGVTHTISNIGPSTIDEAYELTVMLTLVMTASTGPPLTITAKIMDESSNDISLAIGSASNPVLNGASNPQWFHWTSGVQVRSAGTNPGLNIQYFCSNGTFGGSFHAAVILRPSTA